MISRPDESASSAEIARWMEEDFWDAFADGIEEAVEDDDTNE